MPGRNSKYLLLANEVNFSEGARNCWGRGGGRLPNHATEGRDFILIVTSNKGYPEDLKRVLRRSEFGKRRRVTVLEPKELKRNYASASSSWDSVQTACCRQHQPAGTHNLPPCGFGG